MTRMIAQTYKNTRENKDIGAQPKAAPVFSLCSLMFLRIWAIIQVIRMIALATRMISLYHPNHPGLTYKPDYIGNALYTPNTLYLMLLIPF